jgi:tetratricopeptide (TPR) repeat protein
MGEWKTCFYCGDNQKLIHQNPLVCECGWYDRESEVDSNKKMESRKVVVLIATAISLCFSYVHLAKWGDDALSVPLMIFQDQVGLLSAQGYEKLAGACIKANKWSCAENAYAKSFEKSKDASTLNKLATLQLQLGESKKATVQFSSYFKSGGKDGAAMLAYAKLLESEKNYKEALQFYRSSAISRTEVLPVQATGGIVRILIKKGRYTEAKSEITRFHKSAENAKGYFNTELAQLKTLLREGRKVAQF